MKSIFVIRKIIFSITEVESKTSDNIWSVIGYTEVKIEQGTEFICNSAHYGDSSKNFIVENIYLWGESIKSLPSGWKGRLFLQGPEGLDLEDLGHYFYPKIPGIERLSDDFWRIHGHVTNYEVKLGDLVFFGTVVEKDRDVIVDNLKPDMILVVEDILINGEHATTIAPQQEGFLILKGGDMQNIEDVELLCW